MRFLLCMSIALATACGASDSESTDESANTAAGGSALELGDGVEAGDTGTVDEEVDAAFVPTDGGYEYLEFRLKEDSCGIDSVAPVTSLMPSNYGLSASDAVDGFRLGSTDQGTETECTVGALDPETGLANFACDSFREGYRSPYGEGFDMEVSFSGDVTDEQLIAGPLTIVLYCMAGGFCDDLARNGVAFPCTIGGDLLLQPVDQ